MEQFENIYRGFMIPENIQLFMGTDFKAIPIEAYDNLPKADIGTIKAKFKSMYNKEEVTVYNGVKIGKVGEVWSRWR